jgi:myosin heavy subunit
LQDARREIEEVKSQAAEVAGELAKVSQQLNEKQTELQRITDEYSPERLEYLKRKLAHITAEHDAISLQLPALRAERDIALKQIEEAKTSIALEAARRIERDNLVKEIEDLQRQKEPLEALRKEADRVRASRDALTEEVARLENRKVRLELETGSEIAESDQKKLLDDLTKVPFCLEFPAIKLGAPRTEFEALHSVNQYLKAYNLEYSTRTILAFHTALKINDHSQLTVLAGVSGRHTGHDRRSTGSRFDRWKEPSSNTSIRKKGYRTGCRPRRDRCTAFESCITLPGVAHRKRGHDECFRNDPFTERGSTAGVDVDPSRADRWTCIQ